MASEGEISEWTFQTQTGEQRRAVLAAGMVWACSLRWFDLWWWPLWAFPIMSRGCGSACWWVGF